ncbi:MAG: formylglycine-generating enzyme family protein [Pontiellaceae bacterium]|nr:formylglycine-generating enzyme family protein [Pontiellaceae bacterium]MBN2785179.1 formylglycine-generating enzyme family protein [Pontiellaceae bacterium]
MSIFKFLVVFFAALMGRMDSFAEPNGFNSDFLRECIDRNRVFFEKRIDSKVNSKKNVFFDRINQEELSAVEWGKILRDLADTNNHLHTDKADLELFVAALYSNDSAIEEYAINKLLWGVGNATRSTIADGIRQALGVCPKSLEAKFLVAKCGLTENEKQILLESVDHEDLVLQAICSDITAERKIIEKFISTTDYDEKSRWVKPLALIGSRDCAETLVNGLASPVFRIQDGYYISIRNSIIGYLRLIYEDKDCLFSDLQLYGPKHILMEDVDDLAKREFGHPAWNSPFVFFYQQVIYPRNYCNCFKNEPLEDILVSQDDEQLKFGDGPRVNQVWVVDLGSGLNIDFMPIAPGSFHIGSNNFNINEMPVHQVILKDVFWIAKTEVTQGQYRQVMGFNPPEFRGDNYACDQVSRQDAYAFCMKLTERERKAGHIPVGYEYTLPSEAQWEYACRAGSEADGVTNLETVAWYNESLGDGFPSSHQVEKKKPNQWGLYDMLGNVSEWCSDCYHVTYLGAPSDGCCWGGGHGAMCQGIVRGGNMMSIENELHFSARVPLGVLGFRDYYMTGFRPVLQPIKKIRYKVRR